MNSPPETVALEADEGARLGRFLEGGLVVQPDVVLGERLLVDLLVDGVALGEELAQAGGVDGVEARVEVERLPELAEAGRILHQIEVAEPYRAMLGEHLLELVDPVEKVLLPGGVGGRGGNHLDGARFSLLALILRLPVRNVQLVRVPDRGRAVGQCAAQRSRLGVRRQPHLCRHGAHPRRARHDGWPRRPGGKLRKAERHCKRQARRQGRDDHRCTTR